MIVGQGRAKAAAVHVAGFLKSWRIARPIRLRIVELIINAIRVQLLMSLRSEVRRESNDVAHPAFHRPGAHQRGYAVPVAKEGVSVRFDMADEVADFGGGRRDPDGPSACSENHGAHPTGVETTARPLASASKRVSGPASVMLVMTSKSSSR